MKPERAMLVVVLAYSTALGALALAGFVAAYRCSHEDCSAELAFGVIAAGPASLLAAVALLLLRNRVGFGWLRSGLLAASVTVATAPLVAFLFEDAVPLGLYAVGLGAAVMLVLRGGEPAAASSVEGAQRGLERNPPLAAGRSFDDSAVGTRVVGELALFQETVRALLSDLRKIETLDVSSSLPAQRRQGRPTRGGPKSPSW